MISEERLQELERLAADATTGPWHKCNHDICTVDCGGDYRTCEEKECEGKLVILESQENLKFIIAAREGVPELIKTVREQKGMIKEMCSFCCGFLEMRCYKCPLNKKE